MARPEMWGQYTPPRYTLRMRLWRMWCRAKSKCKRAVLPQFGIPVDELGQVNAYPVAFRREQNLSAEVGRAIDDLYDLMEWLREDKQYAQSDRLRTIMGRLARARPWQPGDHDELIRDIARKFK